MKVLVKCKFYFLMLLAAVLLAIGTASSDNQTKLSTGDTTQMAKKTDDYDSWQLALFKSGNGCHQ